MKRAALAALFLSGCSSVQVVPVFDSPAHIAGFCAAYFEPSKSTSLSITVEPSEPTWVVKAKATFKF